MILVEADAGEEWDSRTDWEDLARRAVFSAVSKSSLSALADGEAVVEVSVRFTSDDEVRALNAGYRGKDKPTNVLSFPMFEAGMLASVPAGREILLGDVVLAYGVCAAEAADKSVSVEIHAAHLVVHGTLHLLGYDHETSEEDAQAMEALEREALAALGISDPYAVTEAETYING
jgi:probable rRNA maturation factor